MFLLSIPASLQEKKKFRCNFRGKKNIVLSSDEVLKKKIFISRTLIITKALYVTNLTEFESHQMSPHIGREDHKTFYTSKMLLMKDLYENLSTWRAAPVILPHKSWLKSDPVGGSGEWQWDEGTLIRTAPGWQWLRSQTAAWWPAHQDEPLVSSLVMTTRCKHQSYFQQKIAALEQDRLLWEDNCGSAWKYFEAPESDNTHTEQRGARGSLTIAI